MPEFPELEFTGERVVPGLVDPDLLNEHLARYRFAARFGANLAADGARVLDAGCGTGYGSAEFGFPSSVIGVDISAEAVAHARREFSRPGIHFLQAGCESLPFADGSFDLVAAFEVIEHLERWEQLLAEACRVLRPAGVLLVSTPNKAYYAEARGAAGPNPYHVREFEYDEFAAALRAVFPHVNLWSQNHSEVIAIVPATPSSGDFDAPGAAVPEHAHFFLAACSRSPIPAARAFAWSPTSGNVLRERERHIAVLIAEVTQKNDWLREAQEQHAALLANHENLNRELEATHAGYRERVQQLETQAAVRLDWVHDLEAQVRLARDQIARLEHELTERTEWAAALDTKLTRAELQLYLARRSKWVRLGRRFHLGPEITTGDGQPE